MSIELTTLLLATLFDFPMEERRMLTLWSDIAFAVPEPGGVVESQQQKFEEIVGCLHYFEGLWEQRRGASGSDLVSLLANGDATKDMAAVDHLGNLLLLIVGGNDTTRNTMSASVHGLNEYPDQYDNLLADPGLASCRTWCRRSFACRRRCGTCAELQLRVLWEEILQRFERIEIQYEPERTFSSVVHGYTSLPVTVTRR